MIFNEAQRSLFSASPEKSAAFTGYRPEKLPFGDDVGSKSGIILRYNLKKVYSKLIKKGFRTFYVGGARGSDMMAEEVVSELQEEFRRLVQIALVICMPCLDYQSGWPESDKRRFNDLVRSEASGYMLYVSDKKYTRGCMQTRNRYMVDRSSVLVSVYDGQQGGTKYTVDYARRKGRKVLTLDPSRRLNLEFFETPADVDLAIFLDEDEDDLSYADVSRGDIPAIRERLRSGECSLREEARLEDFLERLERLEKNGEIEKLPEKMR